MSRPSPATVIVTFVGGPLHGLQQRLDAPPEQVWRDLPNGSALLYGRRWASAPVGDTPSCAVYSPVGMSEHAYRELLPTVDLQWHEAIAAPSPHPDAKRIGNAGTP